MAQKVMEQEFGEDKLRLEFDEVHYVGFKKQNLFTLTYLTPGGEKINGRWVFYSNNSESYLESERDLAIQAFNERAASARPVMPSKYDRRLEDFVELEVR
jgi:hypothetical protein